MFCEEEEEEEGNWNTEWSACWEEEEAVEVGERESFWVTGWWWVEDRRRGQGGGGQESPGDEGVGRGIGGRMRAWNNIGFIVRWNIRKYQ